MTQIWITQQDPKYPWAAVSLDDCGEVFFLTGDPDQPVVAGASNGAQGAAYVIRHPNSDGRDRWMLFASCQMRVSVNGLILEIGMRTLRDKDEIRVGETVMFFSTEQIAQVLPFPGIGKPCKCPRCQSEILVGTPAVRCPHCGVWHHQSEESPCWTYAEKCAAFCDQSTALDSGLQWVPEDR